MHFLETQQSPELSFALHGTPLVIMAFLKCHSSSTTFPDETLKESLLSLRQTAAKREKLKKKIQEIRPNTVKNSEFPGERILYANITRLHKEIYKASEVNGSILTDYKDKSRR